MWQDIYGLDIETDTTPMEDGTPRGLDPSTSSIINVALATREGEIVFRGDEANLLRSLDRYVRNLPVGLIASWNGAVFDLPFLIDRAKLHGIDLGLKITPTSIIPKYEPLPGHAGGYLGEWASSTHISHAHIDVAYALKDLAASAGVSWSLKPVARYFNLSPVEVDRTSVHLLTAAEQDEYVASDARVTRILAERLLTASL